MTITIKEQIEILQAYERGEEVEWRRKNSDMNFIILNYKPHDFNFEHFEYRIKPKRWRAEDGGVYYCITSLGLVGEDIERNTAGDNRNYSSGNYFQTKEQAEKAREMIKECLISKTNVHDCTRVLN